MQPEDCDDNRVCVKKTPKSAGGICHLGCTSTSGCGAGERCVSSSTDNVCLLAAEAECTYDSDCFVPLVCGPDQRCRDRCKQDYDCIAPQKCTNEHVCAEPNEVDADNRLINVPLHDPGMGANAGAAGAAGESAGMPSNGGTSSGGGTGATGGMSTDAGDTGEAGSPIADGGAAGAPEVAVPCADESECGAGKLCGIAAPDQCGSCTADAQCTGSAAYGAGHLCISGACVEGTCHKDAECDSGLNCLPIGHRCGRSYSQISVSQNGACAVADLGTVWCTGVLVNERSTPVQIKSGTSDGVLNSVTQVAHGTTRACGLKADGSVWCWSRCTGTGACPLPIPEKGADGVTNLSGVEQIATGYYFADFWCALLSDHYVRCWGNVPGGGSLGDGSNAPHNLPVLVNLPGVASLALSDYSGSACALTTEGAVWCWGPNKNGELGTGTTDASLVPVRVKGPLPGSENLSGVVEIKKGGNHTCARKNDGSVYCWGAGATGQLGNGAESDQSLPVQVKDSTGANALKGVTALALGKAHSCALLEDHTVVCWGDGHIGALGSSSAANHSLPVAIPVFGNVTRLSAGGESTCAIKADLSTWCWGYNGDGNLGNGYTESSFSPTRFLP